MKKEQAKVIPITNSCGKIKGCEVVYVMPHGGTQEAFQRHVKEGFKLYPSKQAA